jgi:hypothetical protein
MAGEFIGEGFPTHTLQCAETHVGLRVKCRLLLSDFNQIWKASENFSEELGFKVFVKICEAVLEF